MNSGFFFWRSTSRDFSLDFSDSPTPPPPITMNFSSWAGGSRTVAEVSIWSGSLSPGIFLNLLVDRSQTPGSRPTSAGPYPALEPE